jgi:hypothetical protein
LIMQSAGPSRLFAVLFERDLDSFDPLQHLGFAKFGSTVVHLEFALSDEHFSYFLLSVQVECYDFLASAMV